MTERWIGLNELADETGMSVRNLQYVRVQEPGVLTTKQRGSTTLYKQPDCAINLRKREADKARKEAAPTVSLDEARTRKALAEAELAEMDLAVRRGDLVGVSDYEAALARVLDRLMARLRAMPVRLAHLGDECEAAVEAEVEAVIVELSQMDEDVVDEPAEEAKEAA
jgi:phage terminase Nu1 subunit (DNA packaging protein)